MRYAGLWAFLCAAALLLGACSVFRWSGHPAGTGTATPSPVLPGSLEPEERGHGRPLHEAPVEPSFSVPPSTAPAGR
ncbi:MAG: hypothetical protein HYV14_04885 [Elusimicrobia bacterium]|nr:hypothetical protein [Elusimicrobiota bacterium]